MKIERACQQCGETFQVYESVARKGKGLFCSKSCKSSYQNAARVKSDPVVRFNSYVDRSGDCHVWTGTIDTGTGYGVITVDGKKIGAHVFAWQIANGEKPPKGIHVRHTCDNRPCVNPKHLLLGTPLDNARDCVERNRHPKGEDSARSLLTEREVCDMRRYADRGFSQRSIAAIFGVSRSCVVAVVKRQTWKHVP